MLLVWYKREFPWMDVLRLWEVLWTDYLTSNFHLFIALAILEKHRDVIMEHLQHFDEVLKYINELSNTIDLPSTLLRAESLFRRYQRTLEAVDRKDHFPVPSTVRLRRPGPGSTEPSEESKPAAESSTSRATPALLGKSGDNSEPAESSANASASTGATTSGVEGRPTSVGAVPVDKGKRRSVGDAVVEGIGAEKEKIITTQLRDLLKREVYYKLDKGDVKKHGGGVGT